MRSRLTVTKILQILGLSILLVLGGCSNDSEVTSGGGNTGVGSDGGAGSAKFAGTYSGTITIVITGDNIDDDTETDSVIILIRTNGTARMTIDGESVEGTVNGDRFGFSVRREVSQGLSECEGNAIVSGTIVSGSLTGSVSGSGDCSFLIGKVGFDMSGSLVASKI